MIVMRQLHLQASLNSSEFRQFSLNSKAPQLGFQIFSNAFTGPFTT